jgi:hypothetical protein
MKTLRFLFLSLFVALFSLNFCACSSDDDKSAIDEEEYLEGKIPPDIQIGALYAISHDKKNDKCKYGIYLGEPPSPEMVELIEHGGNGDDVYGDDVPIQIEVWVYGPDQNKPLYYGRMGSTNPYLDPFYEVGETLDIPCYLCEQATKMRMFVHSKYEWPKVGIEKEPASNDFTFNLRPVHHFFE